MRNNKVKKLITTTGVLMVSPISPIDVDTNYVYVEFLYGGDINP